MVNLAGSGDCHEPLLQLDFRTYRRRFQSPLQTHHGLWSDRQGLIVRLRNVDDPTQVAYGEIAPIPWFGTETVEEAIAFCQSLVGSPLSLSVLEPASALMARAPGSATQFGLGAAVMQLSNHCAASRALSVSSPITALPICTLLPIGEKALEALQAFASPAQVPFQDSSQDPSQDPSPLPPQATSQAFSQVADSAKPLKAKTFKWKIGVDDLATEQALLRQLCQHLPSGACLRLDANGGLTRGQAESWLRFCDGFFYDEFLHDAFQIEFLEQPLPPEEFEGMKQLAEQYQTPIALDESVANLDALQACYEKGWRGIFVVKGAIAGHPKALLEFCAQHPLDLVFSSVFETAIARQMVWTLARRLSAGPTPPRALGFGVDHWLENDGWAIATPQQIWEQCMGEQSL